MAGMSVTKISINWDRPQIQLDIDPVLKRFERWLTDRGYRDASIEDYCRAVRLYLKTIGTIAPSVEDAKEYHSNTAGSNLSRATVNIRRAALLAFYRSQGMELKLPGTLPSAHSMRLFQT